MEKPFISIIIPAYNAEKYVAEAIRSVQSQTYPHLEIIVVNDGSADGTDRVLAGFGDEIRVIAQENRGPAHARNRGIEAARGEIIGFLDADDVWEYGHIARLLPFLMEQGFDIAHGLTRYVKNLGEEGETVIREIYTESSCAAALYKRSVFDRAGLFDEELRAGEDTDFAIRVREVGCREARVDTVSLVYRRHGDNLTNDTGLVVLGRLRAFRNKLKRGQK